MRGPALVTQPDLRLLPSRFVGVLDCLLGVLPIDEARQVARCDRDASALVRRFGDGEHVVGASVEAVDGDDVPGWLHGRASLDRQADDPVQGLERRDERFCLRRGSRNGDAAVHDSLASQPPPEPAARVLDASDAARHGELRWTLLARPP